MVMVIWSGGLQAIQGELTVGQIVAFTNYLLTTMSPLIMMTMLSNTWANGIASAERINEVLDTEPEVQDAAGRAARCPPALPGGWSSKTSAFHYNGRETAAGAGGHQSDRRAGRDGCDPGRNRFGKIHAGQPDPALLRRRAGRC